MTAGRATSDFDPDIVNLIFGIFDAVGSFDLDEVCDAISEIDELPVDRPVDERVPGLVVLICMWHIALEAVSEWRTEGVISPADIRVATLAVVDRFEPLSSAPIDPEIFADLIQAGVHGDVTAGWKFLGVQWSEVAAILELDLIQVLLSLAVFGRYILDREDGNGLAWRYAAEDDDAEENWEKRFIQVVAGLNAHGQGVGNPLRRPT